MCIAIIIAVHFLVDIIFHLCKYSIPCECYEKYSQQSTNDLLTLANAIYQYLLFGQKKIIGVLRTDTISQRLNVVCKIVYSQGLP